MLCRRVAMTGVACIALTLCSAGARAGGRVTLRLGTLAVDGSRYMKDIRALSEEIQDKTGGKVRIKWYPNGRLGDEPAMVDLIREGRLDGGGFSDAGLVAIVPEIRAWQYPGLFATYGEVDRATEQLDSEFKDLFSEAGMTFAMWADLGFAHVFANEKIRRWSDTSKHTLWFDSEDEAVVHASELLGVSAKAAPGDGLFAAIAAGHATTWALPPLYALASSVHVNARYIWELRYRYVIGGLVIHSSAWSRLSADQQNTFLEVCGAWEPKIRKRWRRESKKAIAAIDAAGVALVGASDADKNAFRDESVANRDAYAKRWKLVDQMDQIAEAIAAPRR